MVEQKAVPRFVFLFSCFVAIRVLRFRQSDTSKEILGETSQGNADSPIISRQDLQGFAAFHGTSQSFAEWSVCEAIALTKTTVPQIGPKYSNIGVNSPKIVQPLPLFLKLLKIRPLFYAKDIMIWFSLIPQSGASPCAGHTAQGW